MLRAINIKPVIFPDLDMEAAKRHQRRDAPIDAKIQTGAILISIALQQLMAITAVFMRVENQLLVAVLIVIFTCALNVQHVQVKEIRYRDSDQGNFVKCVYVSICILYLTIFLM